MATKREMRTEALALAEKLGVSVEVDRLNAESLQRLLADLKEKAAGAAVSASATAEGFVARTADGREMTSADGVTWTDTAPPSPSDEPAPKPPEATSPAPVVRRARALPPSPPHRPVTGLVSSRKFLRDLAEHAPYVVADGRTIPSTRGTLYAGQGVRDTDFLPGTLEDLVAMGAVLERKRGAQDAASDEPGAEP